MAHKCPACAADVPGVVMQTVMTERLGAKTTEIGLLQTSLLESKDKAGRFDEVDAERGRLASEVVKLNEGATRRTALMAVGVTDTKVSAGFDALYASYSASVEEGTEAKTFSDWVAAEDGARSNPLLSGQFGQPAAAVAAVGAPPANGAPAPVAAVGQPLVAQPSAAAPTGMPAASAGAQSQPPSGQNLMTAVQVRTMLQGMTVAEVTAWQKQHGAAYGWSPPPAPAAAT